MVESDAVLLPSAEDVLQSARDRFLSAPDLGEEDAVPILSATVLDRQEKGLRRLHMVLFHIARVRGRQQEVRGESDAVLVLTVKDGGL